MLRKLKTAQIRLQTCTASLRRGITKQFPADSEEANIRFCMFREDELQGSDLSA